MPQPGPGQLPIVENRAPFTLGAPCEPEKAVPQVVEFEPIKAAIPRTIVLPPTTPPIEVHEPILVALPKIFTVPGVDVPTTPPFSAEPPLLENELPLDPILPSVAKPDEEPQENPFARPTFGAVVALDDPAYTPEAEPEPTLVYWTNDPVQFVPMAKTSPELAVVRHDTPVFVSPLIPRDENPSLVPVIAHPFMQERRSRAQSYMDRLGSRDGTPRFMATYPQYYAAYQSVPMRRFTAPQRQIHGVLHWAFSSTLSVRESLAESFHYFD